jgi:hypothetical protein
MIVNIQLVVILFNLSVRHYMLFVLRNYAHVNLDNQHTCAAT